MNRSLFRIPTVLSTTVRFHAFLDFADFFLVLVTTSPHVQFVYDLMAGRDAFVNGACKWVLHRSLILVNADLSASFARLHPDKRAYLARELGQ